MTEHAVAEQGGERLGDLQVKVVATFGGVGGRLQLLEGLVPSLQVARRFSGRASRLEALAIGDHEVVEPFGQVANRRRVVDHRGGDLVDLGLPLGVGLLLVESFELGNVDADFAGRPLADPEREGGAGSVNDGGGREDSDAHDGQPGQAVSLPGQASLLEGDRIGRP